MLKRFCRRGENILVTRLKYLQRIYTSTVAGTKHCLFDRLVVSIKRWVYMTLVVLRKADGAHCKNGGPVYMSAALKELKTKKTLK